MLKAAFYPVLPMKLNLFRAEASVSSVERDHNDSADRTNPKNARDSVQRMYVFRQ